MIYHVPYQFKSGVQHGFGEACITFKDADVPLTPARIEAIREVIVKKYQHASVVILNIIELEED